MRSFLLTAAALAAVFASPAGAATRNFGITGFEKIRIEGPFRVTLKTGVAPFARASGSQAALDRIAVESRGNTLVIRNSLNAWGSYPGDAPGTVEITLGTHELNSAWLNGSGTLAIDRVKGLSFDLAINGSGAIDISDVEVDQFDASLFGTASTHLSGQALRLTVDVKGVSSLDAARLATHDAKINVDGAATVDAAVKETALVNASGPSTVRLTGKPACTLKVSGSADVSGCK